MKKRRPDELAAEFTDVGPADEPPSPTVSFGNAGYLAFEGGPDGPLLVRVHPDKSGSYRVRELYVRDTGQPITADRLRAIRVGAIEAMLSIPEYQTAIGSRYNLRDRIDLEREAKKYATTYGAPPRQPLKSPSGRGYPDEFYERVAAAYRGALARRARPVASIAVEAGVPRSTAARWVKEARGRGLLGRAPAKGKAGDR
jgi:hypothetical protein